MDLHLTSKSTEPGLPVRLNDVRGHTTFCKMSIPKVG